MSSHSSQAPVQSPAGGSQTGGAPAVTASSVYPLPPMRYIQMFSDDNVSPAKCPQPPKPVSETGGQYSMFGQTIAIDDHIIRSLESQGLRRLYPREYDHKRELKKMNASILVNFLDILDVLVRCPDTNKREDKTNDIQLLFITMHHLINELRPHQARESIKVLMQSQKRQRLETNARLHKQIEKVRDLINAAINAISDDTLMDALDVKPNAADLMALTKTNASSSAAVAATALEASGQQIDNTYEKDALMCDFVEELALA